MSNFRSRTKDDAGSTFARQQALQPSPARPTQEQIRFERERRLESSKAASEALDARKRALELKEAARGALDASERQKLLERAIDYEIAAESFGKTAKYMRSGAFQGMMVGLGLGAIPGLQLGMLTGRLVGGTVGLITGGLGAAGGAITGALHGPWVNLGEMAGQGVRKITGNGPSWEATTEQKLHLQKMTGEINAMDMPTDLDLQEMATWSEGPNALFLDGEAGGWSGYTTAMAPSTSRKVGSGKVRPADVRDVVQEARGKSVKSRLQVATSSPIVVGPNTATQRPRISSNMPVEQTLPQANRPKPRKLESRSQIDQVKTPPITTHPKRKPRKLEVRSPGPLGLAVDETGDYLKCKSPSII